MMAGNPNWWNMHPPVLFPPQVLANGSSSSSVIPLMNSLPDQHVQDPPQFWSQLFLSGNTGLSEEDRLLFGHYNHFQPKKLENWEDQMIISSTTTSTTVNSPPPRLVNIVDQVKQEAVINNISQKGNNSYGQADHDDQDQILLQQPTIINIASCGNWSQVMPAVSSSPRSCITSNLGSTTNNMLDFSYNKSQTTDHSASSECNNTATGGAVCKKARVQSSSSQPPLKVRKEKLGDRITALHQLVSPFGKTDTASVLLEAIGYIRFLQSQIEALSSPYLGHASKNMRNQPYDIEGQEKLKDLGSRGLCLVPVSCTQHVGSDNGADYWAPADYGSGF